MAEMETRLDELAARVRRDLQVLAYPDVRWVTGMQHPSGQHVYDVIIVGAGQSGLAIAFALRREGVTNVVALDRSPTGFEGPWATFARMAELRTPKALVGTELGLPNLSVRAWFEARYGADAWEGIVRIPRQDWLAYLAWYRRILDLPVRNETEVDGIAFDGRSFVVGTSGPGGAQTLLARRVVLATGYDGGGEWRVPPMISSALPASTYAHSNGPIDFAPLRGKRVGVLGHGASAFDASVAALEAGAASVDLCFRRPELPSVNPHRWIEFTGFLKHFPDLDDPTRWMVNRHLKAIDQPPAPHSYEKARKFADFALHPASPWERVGYTEDTIRVVTPDRDFAFDFVICATGMTIDLAHRRELTSFVSSIALWSDKYQPPAGAAHPMLAAYPYLGGAYEFQEKRPGEAPYLQWLHAFNSSAAVSMGQHSTSISGHKYSIPRVVAGITRSLFVEQAPALLPALADYRVAELPREGANAAA